MQIKVMSLSRRPSRPVGLTARTGDTASKRHLRRTQCRCVSEAKSLVPECLKAKTKILRRHAPQNNMKEDFGYTLVFARGQDLTCIFGEENSLNGRYPLGNGLTINDL